MADLRGSEIGFSDTRSNTRTVQSSKAFLWAHHKTVFSVYGLWWVAAVGSGRVFLREARIGDF